MSSSTSSTNKKAWCGDCEKGWCRKVDYDNHFSLLNVKDGGKLVNNHCFNRKRKSFGTSLSDAIKNKKGKTISDLFSNTASDIASGSGSSSINSKDDTDKFDCEETIIQDTENVSNLAAAKLEVIDAKLDMVLDAVKEMPKQVTSIFAGNLNQQAVFNSEKYQNNPTNDGNYERDINDLKQANSMASIKANKLVSNKFSIKLEEEDETEYMRCDICSKWANPISSQKLRQELVEGSEYSVNQSGVKKPMSKAFSNFKLGLVKHIESQSHKQSLIKEKDYNFKYSNAKESIAVAMRQTAYFTIKCNLPFNQFESLCATNVYCGLELGDINHTRFFIDQFLDLVNNELIIKTADWFKDQEAVTITLDIGTECGIPLLAVLFISGGKAKLANITPVISKKGEDVALACFDACTLSNQLTEKDLESKICGVTGDGAFAKGNAPFKNKMEVLF